MGITEGLGVSNSPDYSFIHYFATSSNMGEFNCLLHHQLDLQCHSFILNAHNYVRLCRQPSYWITMFLIVAVGMGPILALKYLRFTYTPSKINTLQQAERSGGPILTIGNIEPQTRSLDKEVSPLSITLLVKRNPVYEPLLSDSPLAT